MENRQHKGGCLAGAGLGGADQVMSVQSGRDGLYLNGRWRAIASVFDTRLQARIQIELVEVHKCSFSSEVRRMLGIERTLKGITAATTAELINKSDTITDDSRTVKDVFFQNSRMCYLV